MRNYEVWHFLLSFFHSLSYDSLYLMILDIPITSIFLPNLQPLLRTLTKERDPKKNPQRTAPRPRSSDHPAERRRACLRLEILMSFPWQLLSVACRVTESPTPLTSPADSRCEARGGRKEARHSLLSCAPDLCLLTVVSLARGRKRMWAKCFVANVSHEREENIGDGYTRN